MTLTVSENAKQSKLEPKSKIGFLEYRIKSCEAGHWDRFWILLMVRKWMFRKRNFQGKIYNSQGLPSFIYSWNVYYNSNTRFTVHYNIDVCFLAPIYLLYKE